VKPPQFTYSAPATLAEVLQLLASRPGARLLAGGQSLMPMLNMRLVFPEQIVDLNRVAGLAYIREEGDEVVIGAMTRQREIEFSPLVQARLPLLAEAIRLVGHRQTRNRGTLGGSLCHLDPSAELPAAAMALDAALQIEGPRGSRVVPMADFPAGLMKPAIDPDEILTSVRLKPWAPGHGSAFVEFARRHGDFAVVSAAALIELHGDGRIRRVSITLGGVTPAPLRMRQAEESLHAAVPEAERFRRAADLCADLDALEDPAYPAWYRQRLAVSLAQRALELAARRAKRA
jgi:aerobic carbon-monoxide dehydrogenase medium subunit